MPPASETVGCLMIGEFLDEPESGMASAGGKSGTAPAEAGMHIVCEFVDPATHAEPPAKAAHLPLDVQTSAAAMELYDRALTLYEHLVQHGGRSDLASELARARANKAIAIRELGHERAAAALADQTIALYELLVQQEGRHELTNELSTLYDDKAAMLGQLGDMDLARTYQEKADALCHLGRNARNVWIEGQEDLQVRPLPPDKPAS
jgi:tetratricopeptide (TPR) repeat protein